MSESRQRGGRFGFGRYLSIGFMGVLALGRLISAVSRAGKGQLRLAAADLLFASAAASIAFSWLRQTFGFRARLLVIGVAMVLIGVSMTLDSPASMDGSTHGIFVWGGVAVAACGVWILGLDRVTFGPRRRLPENLRAEVAALPPAVASGQQRVVRVVLRDGRQISKVRVVSGGYVLHTRGNPRFDPREAVAVAPEQ